MIDKEANMSEPKILRLMTKEIIICTIKMSDTENPNYWIVEDPFEIRTFMNPSNGDFNSTLVDWLQFTSDCETKLCVTDVLTCNTPDGEILEHYLRIVQIKKNDKILKSQSKQNIPLDIHNKVKSSRESEIKFDDYMEILNSNKVYH